MSYQALNSTGEQDLENNLVQYVNDSENERYPFGKSVMLCRSVATQMTFIRKIWTILAIHILTIILTTLLLYICDWRHIVQRFIWFWWLSLISSMGLLFFLTYKSNDDYQPPWFLILIYALFNSYTVGSIVCLLDLTSVIDLLILLFIASFSVICFTLQTTYKFKSKESIFLVCTTIIVTSFILHPLVFSIIDAFPAVSIAILLSLFFVFDTWYMMDNMNKYEYKGAAMQLILDLLVPFKCIHHMSELSAEYW
ncbi:protein lifeguard 4-like [Gigaspora margarita]|uniref:Protein lifeguard 4-like n=1 Tax=Gigaspora margarita TaxID=4874 RepID=A0A8H4EUK6_GIGMA|nr:protein lifeguard 4-like [Gigaspora margarita]